jgi:hypothetical protein
MSGHPPMSLSSPTEFDSLFEPLLDSDGAAQLLRIHPKTSQQAVDHSPSNAKRLGVRLALHQRRTSILACPTAQDSHQTGRSKSGFAEHRMAQFPPHGQRLGQRGRVATGRCQDLIASREHRNHLGHLWEFGHRSEATDSAKAGQFRQRAASNHYSIKERDPYLTHKPFGDSLQPAERNGSSGRTRTYNPPVNSRMLCH